MTTTVWNSADKTSGITLSGSNLVATCSASFSNEGVRATNPEPLASTRKVYVEYASNTFINSDDDIGLVPETWTLGNSPPAFAGVFQFGNSAAFSAPGTSGYSPSGKVVGMAIDFGAKKIWIREDSGDWNRNSSADPVTGAGATAWTGVSVGGSFYHLSARLRQSGSTCTLNVGGSGGGTPFAFAAPAGFEPWDGAGTPLVLAQPVIIICQ